MANFLYALYLTSCLLSNFEYGGLGDLLSRTEADRSLHFFYGNERQLRTVRNERDEFYRFTRDGNRAVIKEQGEVGLVPFLYQGQYLDTETGLAYNRFRYYSPETGAYISQDPIRLEAGLSNLYAYVHDVNAWVDPWGLVLIEGDPSTINYSQRTVSEVRVFDINKYEPIRVIEVDGQLVSYDNRRLLAAQNANLGSLTVDLLDKNDIAISKEGKQTTWWQRFQKRYADKRNIKAGGVVPDTGLSKKTIKASLIH